MSNDEDDLLAKCVMPFCFSCARNCTLATRNHEHEKEKAIVFLLPPARGRLGSAAREGVDSRGKDGGATVRVRDCTGRAL